MHNQFHVSTGQEACPHACRRPNVYKINFFKRPRYAAKLPLLYKGWPATICCHHNQASIRKPEHIENNWKYTILKKPTTNLITCSCESVQYGCCCVTTRFQLDHALVYIHGAFCPEREHRWLLHLRDMAMYTTLRQNICTSVSTQILYLSSNHLHQNK